MQLAKGSIDKSLYFYVTNNSDGSPKTALTHSDLASAYYVRSRSAPASIGSLSTLAAATTAHTDGGFKEIDATNMPGVYRFDPPDAAWAAGAEQVKVYLRFTSSYRAEPITVDLESLTADVENVRAAVHRGRVSIYVAWDGNNSNPGTASSPKLTIAGALAALNAASARDGATIFIGPGTFMTPVEIELFGGGDLGLRVVGSGRERTIIQATGSSASYLVGVDQWTTLEDLTVYHGSSHADSTAIFGLCEMRRVAVQGSNCVDATGDWEVPGAWGPLVWEEVALIGWRTGLTAMGHNSAVGIYPLALRNCSIFLDSNLISTAPSYQRALWLENIRVTVVDCDIRAFCDTADNAAISLLYHTTGTVYADFIGCALRMVQLSGSNAWTVNSASGAITNLVGCHFARGTTTGGGTVNIQEKPPEDTIATINTNVGNLPTAAALLATNNGGDTVGEQLVAAAAGGGGPTAGEIVDAIKAEDFGAKTLQEHLDDLATAVGEVPTAAENTTAILGGTIDTITLSKTLQAILAAVGGEATVSGSTVNFKARDGSTTVLSVTVGTSEGERTSSTIF